MCQLSKASVSFTAQAYKDLLSKLYSAIQASYKSAYMAILKWKWMVLLLSCIIHTLTSSLLSDRTIMNAIETL